MITLRNALYSLVAAGSLLMAGVFGAALFYGDGVITPAISVLSAVEGLKLAIPSLTPYVVQITIAVLVGLFMLQKRGTAGIGGGSSSSTCRSTAAMLSPRNGG